MRCEAGSSATLICAPHRSPTTAETKSATHAAQRTRTIVMELTSRIVTVAFLSHAACRRRAPGRDAVRRRRHDLSRTDAALHPVFLEKFFDISHRIRHTILRQTFQKHAAIE